ILLYCGLSARRLTATPALSDRCGRISWLTITSNRTNHLLVRASRISALSPPCASANPRALSPCRRAAWLSLASCAAASWLGCPGSADSQRDRRSLERGADRDARGPGASANLL